MSDLTIKKIGHNRCEVEIENRRKVHVIVDLGGAESMEKAMEYWAIAQWHRAKGHKPPWRALQAPVLEWIT